MNKKPLLYIFTSIALAIVAGCVTAPDQTYLIQAYGLVGKLFLNALNLVVIPLVAASIITGTARMAADGSFKSLGVRVLLYFVSTTTIATLLGYTFGIIVKPGATAGAIPAELVTSKSALETLTQVLTQVVPHNIFAAASSGQVVGVIAVSLIVGLILPSIDKRCGEVILAFWDGILEIMMKITRLVIRVLPIGVFGLIAKVVAETGVETLFCAGWFCVTTIIALAVYLFVVLPLLLFFVGKVNPWNHFKAMWPAMLTAFTTSSSVATIPVTVECLEKRAGISSRLASFVVPLGASLNMSGSAIYIILAVMTIVQAYGIDLSMAQQAIMIFMTILLCTGEAGIPSASLVAIMMILPTLQIPSEGIGLVLIVDRILDMCRTPVTVFGNSCCAVFAAQKQEKMAVA